MRVESVGPLDAEIFIVGEAPGETEDKQGKPFVGKSGKILDRYLYQAGINRHLCRIGNVAKERPPGNDINYFFEDKGQEKPKSFMKGWIEELKKELITVKPNIVIALGKTAIKALCDVGSITAHRGTIMESTLVPGQKVLGTFHPMNISYEPGNLFAFVMDLRKAYANSTTPDLLIDDRELRTKVSRQEFIDYLRFLQDKKDPIAFDIESDPNRNSHTTIVGLGHNSKFAMCFSFLNGSYTKYSEEAEFEIWEELYRTLSVVPLIGHNIKYDVGKMLYSHGIYCRNIYHDTCISAHVCWPEAPRSLGFISSICLNVPSWKHTSSDDPELYNTQDVTNTYGCYEFLEAEIDKQDQRDIFNFEMKQNEVAIMMELQGIRIDKKYQNEKTQELENDVIRLQSEIEQSIGREINLSSPKQVKELLYVDLELPEQYKRRKSKAEKRKVTSNAEALSKLSNISDDPILEKIIEFKKKNKLLEFVSMKTSPEGRIHTSYNITGSTVQRQEKKTVIDDEDTHRSFGRWSSSKSIIIPYGANLQNIPPEARKMARAPEGYKWVQADYRQAEAVVVSFIIGDTIMKNMFKKSYGMSSKELKENNYDIHKITAALIFGVHIDDITKEQRDIGKAIRHAISYSAGPAVLASKINSSIAIARQLLILYHNTTPQLRMWHTKIQEQLRETRTLTNLLGRKHKFLAPWGDELFRSAYSYIPQSTIGDLLNKALISFYDSCGDLFEIALQLHDAMYAIVRNDSVDTAMRKMKKAMEIPLYFDDEEFFVDVDFKVGSSWGDMEDVEYAIIAG
jgi:uracil-DNA glycosylase family 4